MSGGRDDAAEAATTLRGMKEAIGAIPDHPRVQELEGATTPADERAALWADLRPRLHEALEAMLAELSLPELHALAAHPDDVAALVLVVGLGARADALDPVVTQDEAAELLADLCVTSQIIRHLVTEDVLPARLRRSYLLGVSAGELLAARRAVGASRSTEGLGTSRVTGTSPIPTESSPVEDNS